MHKACDVSDLRDYAEFPDFNRQMYFDSQYDIRSHLFIDISQIGIEIVVMF